MKLVECVPNFSEAKNTTTIEAISNTIRSIDGVTLLDVDSGIDTNRTVMTFVGTPEKVSLAAFNAIKIASELIDMSNTKVLIQELEPLMFAHLFQYQKFLLMNVKLLLKKLLIKLALS